VAICRALAAQPALVLLDEPLSAVDGLTREELRSYLHLLFADTGTTALHVTHDPTEAFALARHVGVIEQGRLVQWDTPQALYRQPESEVVAGLTGAFRSVEVMAEPLRHGQARVWFDDREWICPAHPLVRKGRARLLLRPESIRFSDRQGPWRLLKRRFDAGSFHIEAQNPRGERIHGLSAQNLPLDSATVELLPQHCWLLPEGPTASAEVCAPTLQ
jgi:ABC-type sulfate/molybdate transport systems ATPase subunit